jgi:prevent-host-death family protein
MTLDFIAERVKRRRVIVHLT